MVYVYARSASYVLTSLIPNRPHRVRQADGTVEAIDFREVAPAAATASMFVGQPSKAQKGGLSVAVPGELAGLEYAWKKYGRLPWSALVAPAIALARNFPVDRHLANGLRVLLSKPNAVYLITYTQNHTNRIHISR